ncbi:MAG: glycosyltransferase [Anaerolineae bacterium]|nr:glycosyltransferase [Anaerolineae bacterium]
MARVLFLTQVLPYPLNAGPKIRAYHVLQHLAQRHEITLVSFVRADDHPESVRHLETLCAAVHTVPMRRSLALNVRAGIKAAITGLPGIIVRDEIAEMFRLLRRLTSEIPFDVVHVDQTSMTAYGKYARTQSARTQSARAGSAAPKAVFDAHNALYRIFGQMAEDEPAFIRRQLFARESRALRRYETRLLSGFDHVVFVTDEDRKALGAPEPTTDNGFTVIPICVDPEEKPLVSAVSEPRAITHLGTMFWPPNVAGVLWFAREVFPRVLDKAPDARFVIVGKDPPPEVEALSLQVRNIRVTGYVPDPRPYLAETAAFIVPLHAGAGMRVKIIDAWCWGMPIVSTPLGIEGIESLPGEQALVAGEPAAFAEAVIALLTDSGLREKLRIQGRRWVEEQYNWRTVYTRWDDVYAACLSGLASRS